MLRDKQVADRQEDHRHRDRDQGDDRTLAVFGRSCDRDHGGDRARSGDERNRVGDDDAAVEALGLLAGLFASLSPARFTAEEHLETHQGHDQATGDTEGPEIDPHYVKQLTADQRRSEKCHGDHDRDSPDELAPALGLDPAKVAASTALLEVETGSFDFGDPGYNAEVRKKSWFDSATYPKAKFQSTAIKPGAAGTFTAAGTLTLKGRVLTVNVPVKVAPGAKGGFVFDGSFAISRKAFGIGDPVWEGTVDDKVTIKFHLTGAKQ